MKTIYKYQLYETDNQTLSIPAGFEILSIQNQEDRITMWTLVDTDNSKLDFKFKIVGTGHPIHFDINEWIYYATVRVGIFVWHILCEV